MNTSPKAAVNTRTETKPVRVISVTSGKGGVGKTNIVTNLAMVLAMAGHKVLIWDADLGLANIDVLLGLKPEFNIQHLLNGEKSLKEIIVKGPSGLLIMPASSGVQELANLGEGQKVRLPFGNGRFQPGSGLSFHRHGRRHFHQRHLF
jgi:flagellar biosynthesis protein FlhG